MKVFNTTGTCNPDVHYMVNIDRQVGAAAQLVSQGRYFCINRGRQYGKTTTLAALKKRLLSDGYAVFSISFEDLSDSAYDSVESLLFAIVQKFNDCIEWTEGLKLSDYASGLIRSMEEDNATTSKVNVQTFSRAIARISKSERLVALIDEVDQAGNYPAFLKLLGILREMYLSRNERPTFQSVILAGVYDVKNLKLKIRPDDHHQFNSPWNIAATYDEAMNLPADGIARMLEEYRSDHSIEFDCISVGQLIYDYTSGYPFLVSRICQIIDEAHLSWDKGGILKATHEMLSERNTLFDDMVKKLDEYPELKDAMRHILYSGTRYAYNPDEKFMQIAMMFNFVKVEQGGLAVACRLMETRMYNYFLSEEKTSDFYRHGDMEKSQFVHDGYIDMRLLMERFCVHFSEIYRPGDDDKFVEENGRKIFLTYLRPIINGIGNYYCEAQTRDMTRTDVIIDYLGQQYIVELKIWHGNAYNERGERQLAEYLNHYHLKTGYMVSFCFNKNKQTGIKEVMLGDLKLIEAIV